MTHVQRSAIVPYTPEQMYALVIDVARYPEFLPWCSAARVVAKDADSVMARLSLSRGPAHGSFTTRNEFQPPNQVAMHLVDGPFESLEGLWRFQRIGDAGSRVSLDVQFRMKHVLAAMLLGRAFEKSCDQLVDSFCRRAAQVYG